METHSGLRSSVPQHIDQQTTLLKLRRRHSRFLFAVPTVERSSTSYKDNCYGNFLGPWGGTTLIWLDVISTSRSILQVEDFQRAATQRVSFDIASGVTRFDADSCHKWSLVLMTVLLTGHLKAKGVAVINLRRTTYTEQRHKRPTLRCCSLGSSSIGDVDNCLLVIRHAYSYGLAPYWRLSMLLLIALEMLDDSNT